MLEINSYDQINYFWSNLSHSGVKLSECIVVIRNNLNNTSSNTSIAYIDIVFMWKNKKIRIFNLYPNTETLSQKFCYFQIEDFPYLPLLLWFCLGKQIWSQAF